MLWNCTHHSCTQFSPGVFLSFFFPQASLLARAHLVSEVFLVHCHHWEGPVSMKSLQFAVNYHLQNQTVWIFSFLSGCLVTQTLPAGLHRKNSCYCVMPQECYKNTSKSPKQPFYSWILVITLHEISWTRRWKLAKQHMSPERWEMVCSIHVHQTVASKTMHRKQLSLTEPLLPYYYHA